MKKIIILITVLFFFKTSFSQYPNGIQTIGNDSNVVQAKGGFKGRVINWTYTDTTAANLERIRQYVGAQMVTTTPTLKFWIRNATATGWIDITSGGGASQTWQQTLLVSGGSLLTQNNDIDVAGYDFRFSSADEFGVGADSVSISINQALGRFKVTGIPSTDTTLSLVGITANGYLVKTNKSSLRPYTFTNGLTESGGTVKLGGTLTEAATTIDGNQNDLLFTDINEYIVESSVVELNGVSSGSSSSIRLDGVGIYLRPKNYQIFIDSLQATDTTQYIVGYRSNGQLVKTLKSSLGWGLTGNSGTDTATNFIGTTDDEPLRIKVNNQQAGLILNNSPFNTFWGYGAGKSNTTGNINVGVGWGALRDNVTGSSNTAIGLGAIQNATNASEEVAIGYGALANISGQRNVAVGTSAMVNSRDAAENTAVGNYVMLANRQGDGNSAFGSSALRGNADGGSNVGFGNISLTQNTTAFYAVSVTSGGSGYAAGDTVLTVSAPVVAADPNNNSLQAIVRCTVVAGVVTSARIIEPGKGYSSYAPPTATLSGSGTGATFSISLTSGEYNTAAGVGSLSANRTGKYNTGYGYAAGAGIDTGVNNTFIGYNAGNTGQLSNARNSIAIGVNAITTAHNQFVISDSITSYKLPNIPSGVGTKAVRYNPSTGDLSYADTTTGGGVTTLATFGAGARLPGDTAAFTDSTIYGSFYNDGEDTLVITAMRIVMQGTNDTLTINVEWNDSLNTTGTKLKTAYAAANNNYTGNSYTSFDNTKIPPGNHVWCKSPTVIPGRRPNYLSVTLIGYKKRV